MMEDEDLTIFCPRLASTPEKVGCPARAPASCVYPKHLPPALFTTNPHSNYNQGTLSSTVKQFDVLDPNDFTENVPAPDTDGPAWLSYLSPTGRDHVPTKWSSPHTRTSSSQEYFHPTFDRSWDVQHDRSHLTKFKTFKEVSVRPKADGENHSPLKSPPVRSPTPALGLCLPARGTTLTGPRSSVTNHNTANVNQWANVDSLPFTSECFRRGKQRDITFPFIDSAHLNKMAPKPNRTGIAYRPEIDEFSVKPTTNTDKVGYPQMPRELRPAPPEVAQCNSPRPRQDRELLSARTGLVKTPSALCDTTNLPSFTSSSPSSSAGVRTQRPPVPFDAQQGKSSGAESCPSRHKGADGDRTPYSSSWRHIQWPSNESADSGFDSIHRSPHWNFSKSHDEFSSGEYSSDYYSHRDPCISSVAYSPAILESPLGDKAPGVPEKPDDSRALIPPKVQRKLVEPKRSASPVDPRFRGVTLQMRTRVQQDDKVQLNIKAFFKKSSRLMQKAQKKETGPRKREDLSSSSDSDYADLFPEKKRRGQTSGKQCASCRTKTTPLWRDAEDGTPLCNACGIRYKKYRVRCSRCWHIPRKETKTNLQCTSCGEMLKLSLFRTKQWKC